MQKETDRHRSQKERNLLAHNGIQYPGFQSNELDSAIVKKLTLHFLTYYLCFICLSMEMKISCQSL